VRAAGLSYAMLGHYHTPKDAPYLTYPGNPDPLEFGETGNHAAVLVTVAKDGSVSTVAELDSGTNLLETLQARLALSAAVVGAGASGGG